MDKYDPHKIYDIIYSKRSSYNQHVIKKDKYIDEFVDSINGSILDAGCGQGNHLKRLLNKGVDIFGIEISKFACDTYLQDVSHMNIDIINYIKNYDHKYDGVICLDVLEHISHKDIDELLSLMSTISNNFLFGIANHSDIIEGYELHLIQENEKWWSEKLKKYFDNVVFTEKLSDIFYFFTCTNENKS